MHIQFVSNILEIVWCGLLFMQIGKILLSSERTVLVVEGVCCLNAIKIHYYYSRKIHFERFSFIELKEM